MTPKERRLHSFARRCVEAIIFDLSDRRGLSQEWGRIDDDVRKEIRKVWTGIIHEKFKRIENR